MSCESRNLVWRVRESGLRNWRMTAGMKVTEITRNYVSAWKILRDIYVSISQMELTQHRNCNKRMYTKHCSSGRSIPTSRSVSALHSYHFINIGSHLSLCLLGHGSVLTKLLLLLLLSLFGAVQMKLPFWCVIIKWTFRQWLFLCIAHLFTFLLLVISIQNFTVLKERKTNETKQNKKIIFQQTKCPCALF